MIPDGFIELHYFDSEATWHVRVESIAGYGPEIRDVLGQVLCCPVQLRGQPKAEAANVTEGLREIAKLCIAVQKQAQKGSER